MIKVNLEKELVKQNKSLVSARELLLIKEYERTADIAEDEIIKRVFGELPASKGGRIKQTQERLLGDTKNFNQEKVFHISQIEKLCKKYHLRFLPSVLFKGSIDKDLPSKISQFEIAYGVNCNEWKEVSSPFWFSSTPTFEDGNTYIAAPAKSFSLQEKPKDPLMFFKINSEYFYLIHKWGNDINIIRRVYKFLSGWFVPVAIITIPIFSVGIFLTVKYDKGFIGGVGIVMIVLGLIGTIAQCVFNSDGFRFFKKNEWNSPFKAE